MIKLFRAFLLICAFLVRFLWCQNLTSVTTLTSTTITPTTDNSCQPNVPGCHQEDKKGLFNSTTSEIRPQIQNGRGRTMNFTMSFQDDMRSNGLEMGLPKQKIPNIKTNTKQHSIDDVSVDEMEDDFNLNLTNTMSNIRLLNNMMNSFQMMKNISTCMDGEKIYKLGEKFNRGCDETCQCLKDGVICGQLCKTPYQVKGRNKNPECTEETLEGNSCCVRLVCTVIPDLEAEPTEDCVHKNESYKRGSIFKDGCERVCTCEAAGQVNCKARCPPVQNNTDTCLLLPDPKDPCCKILLCDVEEHDVNKMVTTVSEDINPSSENQIISAKALNSSSVAFSFAYKSKDCNMEVSSNGVNWENMICVDNIVNGLEPGKKYQFKLKNSASNKVEVTLPVQNQTSNSSCIFKGKSYKLREEFHDGCTAFCICENTGVECAPIECPTDFGLDVLDPQCLEWETHPADFVPSPPQCCPEKVQCRNNGSCIYNGETYPNWSELPTKATGCGKRCYCEMSNVTCQQMCPPVSETPPINLHCPANQAILAHPPGDECCSVWTCPNMGRTDEIKIHVLEAIDEATVRLVFSVPAFLVGLHGRIELRYTSDQLNNEPSTWEQQILAPPNDLIATKELEFELGGLQPNTSYKIKISVMMHDIDNAPTSSILTVKTLPPASPVTTLPAIIPVEPDLRVVEVNSTYAKVAWRMFTDFELQFIDGVQLRYKELDDKVYSATPLIHRAVTTYTIEELKPDSIYEVGIYFIPFPSQTTELQAQRTIQIKTTVENDPYKFEVTMDVHHIKSTSVEISWSGVPYPEDKYVNIFRAIYQSDGSREDYSSFKVAKRDSPQSILIQDLKPGTRYRLWLEAYLTNGRTKKSNVKDFVTKLGSLPNPSTSQGKLEGMTLVEANSYYGPLVVVSIVATLAIMSTVILLLILAKKHGTNKAPITSPINRKNNSSAAYDNPTYKVDIQQETMDL